MSKIRIESQIDKCFKSMHEYKEEIRRRYLESLKRDFLYAKKEY